MAALPMPTTGAPMVEWACWLASLGYRVFPCTGKAPAIAKRCKKSCKGECGKWGHGCYDATTNPDTIRAMWAHYKEANIGIATGNGLAVLDIDVRHDGMESWIDLEQTYFELAPTMTALSGSGGGSQHKWVRIPAGMKCKVELAPGIDIKADGGYVIAPPSIHPDTGRAYVWESDYGPDDLEPIDAPEWLLALMRTEEHGNGTHAVSLDPKAVIAEGSRNKALTSLAGAMRRVGSDSDEIYVALCARNARCEPPLDDAEVLRIAEGIAGRYEPEAQCIVTKQSNGPAMSYESAPLGWQNTRAANDTASNGIKPPADMLPNWRKELFYKPKSQELHANQFNITQILRFADHWQRPENLLWYDVLTGRHMIDDEQITHAMLIKIAHWFGGAERMPMSSMKLLEECLYERCEENKRDRIQIWLNELPPWDKKPRLETWLIDTGYATDDAYTRHVSKRLLLSMIARGLRPGCQYRDVVILEGPENIGKSHIVEALASKEFFIVLSMSLDNKEAHIMLQRAWLAELADLDSMSRTEEARLKAFITMEEDTYVPKYLNESISVPRRAVFVGTTNDREYLKSLSGNTRFLPVWVPGPVDLPALREMRLQLFAEARDTFFAAGETWWEMPEEVEAIAKIRREDRRVRSDYEQGLSEWLGALADNRIWQSEHGDPMTLRKYETTWQEIARLFLKLETPEKWKDRSLQIQIGNALKALGWKGVSKRFSSGIVRLWHKEEGIYDF